MATTTFRLAVGDTSNTSSYGAGGSTPATFTPAVSDLVVVLVQITSSTVAGGATFACTDNKTGGTYTSIRTELFGTSASSLILFVRDNLIATSTACQVTVTCTGDAGTGAVVGVWTVAGMTKAGSTAVLQTAGRSNQTSGTTPTMTFGSAAQTGNVIVGALANATNTAGITPPTNFTEDADVGYATPTSGMEMAHRDSGHTATTVTFGSSASQWAAIVAELDTTGGSAITTDASLSYTATVTGDAVRTQFPAASITETATVTGDLTRTQFPAAALTYTAGITSALAMTLAAAATVTATATVTGSLDVEHPVDASITETATVTSDLTVTKVTDASLSETATITGDLTRTQFPAASVAITASITSDVLTGKVVDGTRAVTATVTSDLDRNAVETGSVAAVAAITGDLTVAHLLQPDAAVALTAGVTGTLTRTAITDAQTDVTATVTGDLTLEQVATATVPLAVDITSALTVFVPIRIKDPSAHETPNPYTAGGSGTSYRATGSGSTYSARETP